MSAAIDFMNVITSYPAGALGRREGTPMPNSDHFIYKVTSEESGGRFALLEGGMPPRMLVPPHVHSREDEISFVIEGTLGAWVGGQEYSLGSGGVLMKPRNIPHAMWNPTDSPVLMLEFITPGAYTKFFEEVGAMPAAWGSDPTVLDEVTARYGQTWIRDAEWLPDVIARHGLRVHGGEAKR